MGVPQLRWRGRSLRFKLALAISTLVVVAVASVSILSIRREQQTFETELRQQADVILTLLTSAMPTMLDAANGEMLEDTLKMLVAEPTALLAVYVFDLAGRNIADSQSLDGDRNADLTDFGLLLVTQDQTLYEMQPGYLIAGRVIVNSEQAVGAIAIALSTLPVQAKVNSVRDQGVAVAIFTIAIGMLVALFVSRSVMYPIRKLVTATHQIAAGDLSRTISMPVGDEVATLATSLEKMRAELQRLYQTLEEEVVNRTQELQESEARFRRVMTSVSDYIYMAKMTSLDNWVNQYISPHVGTLTGYPYDLFLEDSSLWISLIHPDDRGVVDAQVRNFQRGQDSEIDYRIVRADGEIIWIRDSGRVEIDPEDGETIWIFGIATDISDRKRTEAELIQYRHHLEELVEERTQELMQTLQDLRETQAQLIESEKAAALGNLVAGVAHEINTPIGIGVTMASTLKDETDTLLHRYRMNTLTRSALERYLDMAAQSTDLILHNLQRAAQLIQSFKQIAVDQSSLERREFVVRAYLEEIVRNLEPQLRWGHHRIEMIGDPMIQMNSFPGALAQIITNLVLNSINHAYTPDKSGQLLLRFVQEREWLWLEYVDDGHGITGEALTHIFEPFFTTARGRGGSGLGLHIVYNLVTQKLKGQIKCESQPGIGTRFILLLPLRVDEPIDAVAATMFADIVP